GDVLVGADRLAEAGVGVLALEEHRTERAGGLEAVGHHFIAAGAADRGDGLRRTATAGIVRRGAQVGRTLVRILVAHPAAEVQGAVGGVDRCERHAAGIAHALVADRKSTRLNSSHVKISYAVFSLNKSN